MFLEMCNTRMHELKLQESVISCYFQCLHIFAFADALFLIYEFVPWYAEIVIL